jgi:hypothetical protein
MLPFKKKSATFGKSEPTPYSLKIMENVNIPLGRGGYIYGSNIFDPFIFLFVWIESLKLWVILNLRVCELVHNPSLIIYVL